MTILWASLTGPGMKILVNVFYKSLREDLVKILVACCQRPLHEDLIIRTCARSCKDLREDAIRICTTSSHKDLDKTLVKIFMYYAPWNPCKSVIEGHSRERRRSPTRIQENQLKAALHHSESDLTRTKWREGCVFQLCVEVCEPAQSKCTHGHLRRGRLCENLQWKCRRPTPGQPCGAHFVRACAVEMQMDARIYRKNAGYRKNPSVWTQCLRNHETSSWNIFIRSLKHVKWAEFPFLMFTF